MRVVLLDPASYTPPYDHGLASALAARGHDVHLLTSRFLYGRSPDPAGYAREEVFLPLTSRFLALAPRARLRALAKGLEYPASVARASRRIERLRPELVHVQWLPLPRFDLAWLRRLVRRYPTVLTAHDVVPRRSGNLESWREILGLVDAVVVHSARAVEQLAALGVARDRLTRIVHPVFAAPPGHVPRPPRGRTLLFFGLIRAYKGLDVAVRALAEIVREAPGARLVVAGDPVDPVAPVEELARDLGVADRIEWRLRFLDEREVAELMDEAAVVVLPYRELDSSGVLATALGFGRPVVVTDVGSLGDIVREFRAGLVVPPGDAGALAEACIRLLADPELLSGAFRASEEARRALTWTAAAAEHEHLYERVVRARAALAPAGG